MNDQLQYETEVTQELWWIENDPDYEKWIKNRQAENLAFQQEYEDESE